MTDYQKATYISPNPNLKVVASGSVTRDITGTYTQGIVATVQLAANVDAATQFFYAFGTGNYNDSTIPYNFVPDSYETQVNDAGVTDYYFTSVYPYIDTSNNLKLRFNNTSGVSPLPVLVPAHIRIAWYLLEVTQNT
jgi:hypothetical protein